MSKPGWLYPDSQHLECCIQTSESQKSVGLYPEFQKLDMYPEPQKLEDCTQSHKKFDQQLAYSQMNLHVKLAEMVRKIKFNIYILSTLYNKHRITVIFLYSTLPLFSGRNLVQSTTFFIHPWLLKSLQRSVSFSWSLNSFSTKIHRLGGRAQMPLKQMKSSAERTQKS